MQGEIAVLGRQKLQLQAERVISLACSTGGRTLIRSVQDEIDALLTQQQLQLVMLQQQKQQQQQQQADLQAHEARVCDLLQQLQASQVMPAAAAVVCEGSLREQQHSSSLEKQNALLLEAQVVCSRFWA